MKQTVPEVLKTVREYYSKPGNEAGGSLHVVLDDGNVRDSDVLFCISYAKEAGDTDGKSLAEILFKMSKTQRMKIYKNYSKYYL